MKVKKSKFDSSHVCLFLDKTSEKYEELKPTFEKHGLAFKQGKYIFFDVDSIKESGHYSSEALTFIEAHEIAHTILEHEKSSPIVEAEADFLAVLLCKDLNYESAAKFGIEEFEPRNLISFKSFSKKHKSDIIKRLKN